MLRDDIEKGASRLSRNAPFFGATYELLDSSR